jgi:hypothetical protein
MMEYGSRFPNGVSVPTGKLYIGDDVEGSAVTGAAAEINKVVDMFKDAGETGSGDAVFATSPVITLPVFGTATNNSKVEADGTLVFSGTGTVYEDLRVPVTSVKTGGAKDPGFALFLANGASQGVFAYHFDKTAEEELFFAVQIPHSWKIGSPINPHVHWSVITVPAGGTTVRWGLEYTVVDIGGVFSAPVIIYTTATDPVTRYKHLLSGFSDIVMTGVTGVSAMILCRVFRDVANDNFDADAALLEIDFHYEIDTVGSRQPTTK